MDNWRIFDPAARGFNWWVRPSDIVYYDEQDEVSRFRQSRRRSPTVVSIDGACRGNGKPWATAAFGVYFGEESPHNRCGKLPVGMNHTSQAAEIHAARVAMGILHKLDDSVCEDGVVIVTDSDYLFKSITGFILNWENNGFLNAKGRPVVNGEAFRKLNNTIYAWEDFGYPVHFWKVPREENRDADSLANEAFDY